jgi:hypothetical protein
MQTDADIVIAVATHKAYRMPDDPIYLPLEVGKALHPDRNFGIQTDNTGDNISAKNATYSELTGLYWLWKNVDVRYKGLTHYRRLFGTRDAVRLLYHDPYKRLATKDELLKLLNRRDIVVARRRNYYIESVYSHYDHTFDGKQFKAMRRVLMNTTPEYVPAWDKVMQSGGAHIYNMFVMPKELLDTYCTWMFAAVDGLVEEFGPVRDPFLARYPGRVSERLLDTWIYTNKISYAELPVVNAEPVDWLHKGVSFLAAKFAGKKYERSF